MSKIADQLESRTMIGANVTKALMRTQEWIKKKKRAVSDTLVYGQTRAKCVEKKNSNNNAKSKFNERHVRNASHKRCQVANSQCTRIGTLYIANRASRKGCLVIYVRSLATGRDSYYRLPRNGMRLSCFLPVLRGSKP